MSIYIVLIIYILILPIIIRPFCKSEEKKNNAIAFWGMLAIFLLFALKADSVGIDIAGYHTQYDISKFKAWNDNDYVYFETGYVILQKIFSKAGISFHLFTVFIYAVMCISWFLLIKKHSKDSTLSLMIFVCYQYLVFNMSGLRQALATGICIFSYLLMEKHKKLHVIFACILVVLAITIHRSSIVFPTVLLLFYISSKKKNVNILIYIPIIISSMIIRKFVWSYVDTHLRSVDVSTPIILGGNFLFLVGMAFFIYYTIYQVYSQPKRENMHKLEIRSENYTFDLFSERASLWAISANIMFSGSSMLRAAMYFSIILVPAIPNMISYYNARTQWLFKFAFCTFLITLFYLEVLSPNQFNICPYKFCTK